MESRLEAKKKGPGSTSSPIEQIKEVPSELFREEESEKSATPKEDLPEKSSASLLMMRNKKSPRKMRRIRKRKLTTLLMIMETMTLQVLEWFLSKKTDSKEVEKKDQQESLPLREGEGGEKSSGQEEKGSEEKKSIEEVTVEGKQILVPHLHHLHLIQDIRKDHWMKSLLSYSILMIC